MRFSQMFIPTLRETPAEAEAISHKLMLRAGYIRQLASGLYIFLPLGWRVLNRINLILKEEMEAIGAQEISMPILHPAEIWQKTGRWFDIKDEMFRLKDRAGRDMCLGMTHEEIMTWLASKEIRSYRQLPQIWYQIQTKLRDEARPKSGILRTREFLMKDSYSFDIDEDGLSKSYELHEGAYHRIFKRCGIKFYQVESDPGMMGGAVSHEFMAPSLAGEDEIVLCDNCKYAANIEIARSVSPKIEFYDWSYEEIFTPEKKTVQEVSEFLNINKEYFIKSLLFITSGGPVLVLLRGDQELHEKKLAKLIGPFRSALREEVLNILGTEPGFIGPMGHKIPVIADPSLKEGAYITGANKLNFHVKGIRAGIHFDCQWHDLHIVKVGDTCPHCNSLIKIEKAIEVGNIFKLGTKYSVSLNAFFLDKEGQERPIIMGSYGIGPARIAAAAVEQNNDKDGIIWPKNIAPFDLELIPLNIKDNKTIEVTEKLYNILKTKGLDIIVDDRDERPGVKFKDADLIGIPLQLIIGEKNLKNNQVEIKIRRTKEITLSNIDHATNTITDIFKKIE